jgi:uncharacterized protein YjbJ (UPF0337 family)
LKGKAQQVKGKVQRKFGEAESDADRIRDEESEADRDR